MEVLEYKEPSKKQLLEELKEAVTQLALIEKGKLKSRPAKALSMSYKVGTILLFDKQAKRLSKNIPYLKPI